MRVSAHRPGLFITLEGPDGSGKSTQATLLADRLRARGLEVVLTREPGGTALGEQVRRVLLDVDAAERDTASDALLFSAARHQHVIEVIRPALERGAVVVCDRFADSTLAYQGYGGGVALDDLRGLLRLATEGLAPDRTVLLDLPASAGLDRRMVGSAAELTRFEVDEKMGAEFHERVRRGYLAMVDGEPGRWRVVDGGLAPEVVAEAVWAAVSDLFA